MKPPGGKDCEGSGYRAGGIRYHDCGGYSRQWPNAELPFGYLQSEGPEAIRICTLFDKPERREVDVQATYTGAEIPDAPLLWATVSIMMKNTATAVRRHAEALCLQGSRGGLSLGGQILDSNKRNCATCCCIWEFRLWFC